MTNHEDVIEHEACRKHYGKRNNFWYISVLHPLPTIFSNMSKIHIIPCRPHFDLGFADHDGFNFEESKIHVLSICKELLIYIGFLI